MEYLLPAALFGLLLGLFLRTSVGERAGAIVIAGSVTLVAALGGVAILGWMGFELYSHGAHWLGTASDIILHPHISGDTGHLALVVLCGAPLAGFGLFALVLALGEMGWMTWATGLNQNNRHGDPRSRTRLEDRILWIVEVLVTLLVVPVAMANLTGSSLVTIIGSIVALALLLIVPCLMPINQNPDDAQPCYPTEVSEWLMGFGFMLAYFCLLTAMVMATVVSGAAYGL
jgi:hypothetical protein